LKHEVTWKAARKQALLRLQFRSLDPRCDCGSGRFCQLELHRPLRFSLNDYRPGQYPGAVRDIADAEIDEITAAQFAVDREVEQSKVSNLMRVLKLNPDRPDVLRLQRRLLSYQSAFVPGFPTVT
jgi:hypothetical protein